MRTIEKRTSYESLLEYINRLVNEEEFSLPDILKAVNKQEEERTFFMDINLGIMTLGKEYAEFLDELTVAYGEELDKLEEEGTFTIEDDLDRVATAAERYKKHVWEKGSAQIENYLTEETLDGLRTCAKTLWYNEGDDPEPDEDGAVGGIHLSFDRNSPFGSLTYFKPVIFRRDIEMALALLATGNGTVTISFYKGNTHYLYGFCSRDGRLDAVEKWLLEEGVRATEPMGDAVSYVCRQCGFNAAEPGQESEQEIGTESETVSGRIRFS